MAAEAELVRDEVVVRRVVEQMAMLLNDMGFARMPARVLIALTASEEPALTATDLGERLEVSPAAISGAVRYLTQLGMIVREPGIGSRRDLYRLPEDPWYEASALKSAGLKTLADMAAEGAQAMGGAESAGGRRMGEMRDFFLFAITEIDSMVERWRAMRSAR